MNNTRPTSASQFQRSQNNSAILWKPRPSTALNPIPEQPKACPNIELSHEKERPILPKDTLGSRLSLKPSRPASAAPNPPTYKINTQVLSKVFNSEAITPNSQPRSKDHRISLAKKLRSLCNIRSCTLLENCLKEEIVYRKPESLADELRGIWEKGQSEGEKIRIRPQTAIYRAVRTSNVYLPEFERLSVIPEDRKLEIPEEIKKNCEVKSVGKDTGLNIPIFPGFPGKVLKRSKDVRGIKRSQTEYVIKPSVS